MSNAKKFSRQLPLQFTLPGEWTPSSRSDCMRQSANAGTDRSSIREAPDASIDPHARSHPHRHNANSKAKLIGLFPCCFCISISHLLHLLAKIIQDGEVSDLYALRPYENATFGFALEITRPGNGAVVFSRRLV
jgi:hypothetical protein